MVETTPIAHRGDMGHREQVTPGFEGELARCVERGQIEVVYQPIVDLVSHRLLGAEALARWRHPSLGTVTPAGFIAAAELTGDIVKIGRHVLQVAARQLATWNSDRGADEQLSVHVNLSVRQLADFWLVDDVREALGAVGIEPNLLVLEVTESAAVCETFVGDTLAALKALGVKLAIDDFGTGYSSLSYLTRLPVDAIKIDKSFLADLHREAGRTLVRSVLLLARRLHLDTVVEGIEEAEQVRQLIALGARHGQGFHFSRPLSVDEFGQQLGGVALAA